MNLTSAVLIDNANSQIRERIFSGFEWVLLLVFLGILPLVVVYILLFFCLV